MCVGEGEKVTLTLQCPHSPENPLYLRKTTYTIKNSSIIILPKWFTILDGLKLKEHMMSRDVTTRWNSMYDMLKFALEHNAGPSLATAT
jgi:hypothetical protein